MRHLLAVVTTLLVALGVTVALSGAVPLGSETVPAAAAPLAAVPADGPPPAGPLVVAAFGDSVPAGSVCRCRPYPVLLAETAGVRAGRSSAVRDLAEAGLTTAGLVRRLSAPAARDALAAAEVVVVEIGANDLDEAEVLHPTCRRRDPVACSSARLAAMAAGVDGVLRRLHELAPHAEVLVAGYWNVFKDGRVAARLGSSYLRGSLAVTRAANARIAAAAVAHGARYVDLDGPFHSRPVDRLLASDGDHPSAAGHRLISDLLLAAS